MHGATHGYIELYITLARIFFHFDLTFVSGTREEAFGPDVVEYKLLDHFTAQSEGPVIEFQKRTT